MEFCKLAHGIWQNLPRKTVGPTDHQPLPLLTSPIASISESSRENRSLFCMKKVTYTTGRHLILGPIPGRVEVSLSLQMSELDFICSRWTDNADGELDLQKLVAFMPVNLSIDTDVSCHTINPRSQPSLYMKKKSSNFRLKASSMLAIAINATADWSIQHTHALC